ncbi:MAG: hypothetical protein H7222_03840 [Methylotenera sp.]|nr:hypothetical protein [Oligoflexia bacterium]
MGKSAAVLSALISIGTLVCPRVSFSVPFRGGQIYEISSERKILLFTIHAELKEPDAKTRTFVSSYLAADDTEAMSETATYENLKLMKYRVVQKQLNELYELTLADSKLHFSVTRKGKTETSEEKLPENLLIGPSFVPFFQQHWNELKAGRLRFRLAVLDRKASYEFDFQRLREIKFEGQEAVLVKMTPTSSMISAFVQPTYLTLSSDGSRIFEIKGRMLPKLKVGSRWKDFEGEAYFTY